MKWIRLWVDETLDGTTFTELTMEERGVWFCLLALAGRGRRPGIVEAHQGDPWEISALASYLKCSIEVLSSTILKLSQVKKVLLDDKGIISINNWSKYQTSYEKRKSLSLDTAGEVEGEVEGEEDITPYSPPFCKFWEEYPKRVCKAAAYKAWKQISPDVVLIEKILKAIRIQKKSSQWQKDRGQFVPYPSTWLNQRRWEDEIQTENIPVTPKEVDSKPNWLSDAINEGWKI